jgi:2-oxo-4-hydroxy-4-carboxy--5-ureidoimidazoline (OHCU) decarboxylase
VLEVARKRVQNTREIELKTASNELTEIAVLRLRKLVG